MWDTGTNNKLQIGANIAILLGLVMVAFQIQQANTISSAEFLDAAIEDDNSRQLALLGETPNESMVRVLYKPNEATLEDYYIIDRVYDTIIAQLHRSLSLEQVDLNLGSVTGMLRANSHFFACPYGIAYLDSIVAQKEKSQNPANTAFYESIEALREMATRGSASGVMKDRIKRTSEILNRSADNKK